MRVELKPTLPKRNAVEPDRLTPKKNPVPACAALLLFTLTANTLRFSCVISPTGKYDSVEVKVASNRVDVNPKSNLSSI